MEITVQFAARAIDAVRAVAASEILPRYRTVVATRKDDGSLVTEADHASQRMLVRGLRALEDVPVMGEEMARAEQQAIFERGGRYWCVDPLDGTRNFAGGVPFFAVSVALVENARPVFGTVYDPIADEAFFAVRGAGAWLNHKPLAVPREAPVLSQALAEVSLRSPYNTLRSAFKSRAPYKRRITSGSATLSWCHLAAARIDVLVSPAQKMWDYAAGALIAHEAGASLSTLEDDDFWAAPAFAKSALAARGPALLAEWREWLRTEIKNSCTPR
ncbi:MAG TPA: inositol monophosphatase family protein [Usitatibacter sp.]|nr:inositol monophosphatase family protein [Usitatibacter sp.]